MTVVTEADGLDIEAFRKPVLEQIRKDFPSFGPISNRSQRSTNSVSNGGRLRASSPWGGAP